MEYEDRRQTIRKLLNASRIANQAGAVATPPPPEALVGIIQSRLNNFSLLPEQNLSVQPISGAELGGGFAPPGITQDGVKVDLATLNIKQVVDIGYDLQNLAPGVRLVGLVMNPNVKDGRYFDVSYKIARFSIPGVSAEGSEGVDASAPPRPGSPGRFEPEKEGEFE